MEECPVSDEQRATSPRSQRLGAKLAERESSTGRAPPRPATEAVAILEEVVRRDRERLASECDGKTAEARAGR